MSGTGIRESSTKSPRLTRKSSVKDGFQKVTVSSGTNRVNHFSKTLSDSSEDEYETEKHRQPQYLEEEYIQPISEAGLSGERSFEDIYGHTTNSPIHNHIKKGDSINFHGKYPRSKDSKPVVGKQINMHVSVQDSDDSDHESYCEQHVKKQSSLQRGVHPGDKVNLVIGMHDDRSDVSTSDIEIGNPRNRSSSRKQHTVGENIRLNIDMEKEDSHNSFSSPSSVQRGSPPRICINQHDSEDEYEEEQFDVVIKKAIKIQPSNKKHANKIKKWKQHNDKNEFASSDQHSSDHHSCDNHSCDHHSNDHHSCDHHSNDHHSNDHHSCDHHSNDRRSSDHHSSEHRSNDQNSTEHRSTDYHSTEHHSTGHHHSRNHRLIDRHSSDLSIEDESPHQYRHPHASPTRQSKTNITLSKNRNSKSKIEQDTVKVLLSPLPLKKTSPVVTHLPINIAVDCDPNDEKGYTVLVSKSMDEPDLLSSSTLSPEYSPKYSARNRSPTGYTAKMDSSRKSRVDIKTSHRRSKEEALRRSVNEEQFYQQEENSEIMKFEEYQEKQREEQEREQRIKYEKQQREELEREQRIKYEKQQREELEREQRIKYEKQQREEQEREQRIKYEKQQREELERIEQAEYERIRREREQKHLQEQQFQTEFAKRQEMERQRKHDIERTAIEALKYNKINDYQHKKQYVSTKQNMSSSVQANQNLVNEEYRQQVAEQTRMEQRRLSEVAKLEKLTKLKQVVKLEQSQRLEQATRIEQVANENIRQESQHQDYQRSNYNDGRQHISDISHEFQALDIKNSTPRQLKKANKVGGPPMETTSATSTPMLPRSRKMSMPSNLSTASTPNMRRRNKKISKSFNAGSSPDLRSNLKKKTSNPNAILARSETLTPFESSKSNEHLSKFGKTNATTADIWNKVKTKLQDEHQLTQSEKTMAWTKVTNVLGQKKASSDKSHGNHHGNHSGPPKQFESRNAWSKTNKAMIQQNQQVQQNQQMARQQMARQQFDSKKAWSNTNTMVQQSSQSKSEEQRQFNSKQAWSNTNAMMQRTKQSTNEDRTTFNSKQAWSNTNKMMNGDMRGMTLPANFARQRKTGNEQIGREQAFLASQQHQTTAVQQPQKVEEFHRSQQHQTQSQMVDKSYSESMVEQRNAREVQHNLHSKWQNINKLSIDQQRASRNHSQRQRSKSVSNQGDRFHRHDSHDRQHGEEKERNIESIRVEAKGGVISLIVENADSNASITDNVKHNLANQVYKSNQENSFLRIPNSSSSVKRSQTISGYTNKLQNLIHGNIKTKKRSKSNERHHSMQHNYEHDNNERFYRSSRDIRKKTRDETMLKRVHSYDDINTTRKSKLQLLREGDVRVPGEYVYYTVCTRYFSPESNDWIQNIHRNGRVLVPRDVPHEEKCVFWHDLYEPDNEQITVRKIIPKEKHNERNSYHSDGEDNYTGHRRRGKASHPQIRNRSDFDYDDTDFDRVSVRSDLSFDLGKSRNLQMVR